MTIADGIKKLVSMGLTVDQAVEAARVFEETPVDARRERNRRYYEAHKEERRASELVLKRLNSDAGAESSSRLKSSENRLNSDAGPRAHVEDYNLLSVLEPQEERKKELVPSTQKPKRMNGHDPEVYGEFEGAVWSDFPRHPNSRKQPAFKAYEKLSFDERVECMIGVVRYLERFERETDPKRSNAERLRFVPHLSTWINDKGWESENERPS